MFPSCAGVALTNSPGRAKVPLPEPIEFERLCGFGAAKLPYTPSETGCPKKSQPMSYGQSKIDAKNVFLNGPPPACSYPQAPQEIIHG
jgi:hypothetical protein